jgi:hypothetical protein
LAKAVEIIIKDREKMRAVIRNNLKQEAHLENPCQLDFVIFDIITLPPWPNKRRKYGSYAIFFRAEKFLYLRFQMLHRLQWIATAMPFPNGKFLKTNEILFFPFFGVLSCSSILLVIPFE